MRLGSGIFLLALGAVLAFAVDIALSGVDLQVVGVILMVAGALGVVLELALWAPRRVRTTTYRAGAVPGAGTTTVDER